MELETLKKEHHQPKDEFTEWAKWLSEKKDELEALIEANKNVKEEPELTKRQQCIDALIEVVYPKDKVLALKAIDGLPEEVEFEEEGVKCYCPSSWFMWEYTKQGYEFWEGIDDIFYSYRIENEIN